VQQPVTVTQPDALFHSTATSPPLPSSHAARGHCIHSTAVLRRRSDLREEPLDVSEAQGRIGRGFQTLLIEEA
jgi:hypothetical protein